MSSDRSTLSVHVSRRALWALGFLLTAPWLLFAAWVLQSKYFAQRSTPAPARAVTVNAPATSSEDSSSAAKPGAWGKLSLVRILLEPPEEFVLSTYTVPELRPWVFKGYTQSTLTALWQSAPLTPEQRAWLASADHQEVRRDAIVLRPPADLIRGLSPEARGTLYAALAPFPENASQYNPYRLRSTLAHDWLEQADLPAEALEETRRLLYTRGVSTCFSDEALVLAKIADPAVRTRYVKVLSRKSGLLVTLHVGPEDNVDKLVEYWARGGRSKDLRPLLQSLARRPNGGSIDIVHLLPRLARQLVYTYPLPSDRTIDAMHDCHWTSFNFQNGAADERFSDIDYVKKVLLEQYYPVPGDPLLGDVILLVRPNGEVVHSCVYIADDIVFSKNGPAFSVPWLLTYLDDVRAFYAGAGDIQIRRYRPKDL